MNSPLRRPDFEEFLFRARRFWDNSFSVEQLCFFKFPRPLLDRFGKDFFRGVPAEPGVYVFRGEDQRSLYVGHSKNLRERLSYYKNAQPEREPRRIIRLVHQVRNIELERCDTVNAAQVRELALIRQLRPRFNVANTLSPTYSYFAFRETSGGFALRLSMSQRRNDSETVVGGFRNAGLCRRAFQALARTHIVMERNISTVYDFPACLNSRTQHWVFPNQIRREIEELLYARTAVFAERCSETLSRANDPFLRQILENDLVTLSEFFELSRVMAALRQMHETDVLSQEALQVSGRLPLRPVSAEEFDWGPAEAAF
ncbi:MAG TPA: GIY-YIG nuclease family protein [Verrucomicrobiae bacterium]